MSSITSFSGRNKIIKHNDVIMTQLQRDLWGTGRQADKRAGRQVGRRAGALRGFLELAESHYRGLIKTIVRLYANVPVSRNRFRQITGQKSASVLCSSRSAAALARRRKICRAGNCPNCAWVM